MWLDHGKDNAYRIHENDYCQSIQPQLSAVSEKRLLIDISAIRKTYTCGDLSDVAHVQSALYERKSKVINAN